MTKREKILAAYLQRERDDNQKPEGANVRQIFIDLSNEYNVSFSYVAEIIRTHTIAPIGAG